MAWLTPKTDWTDADRYNFEDINRVESNTEHIKNFLSAMYYAFPMMSFVTNRTQASFDYVSSINRLETNLQTIWQAFILSEEWTLFFWTEDTPFDAETANRWEQELERMYQYAQSVFESIRYCGTFACGQEEYLL